MTEFSVSVRSDLDLRVAGDLRSDATIDAAIEMATAATSITAEPARATIFDALEKWRADKGEGGARPWPPPATARAACQGRYVR